jgi:hypothetical protein
MSHMCELATMERIWETNQIPMPPANPRSGRPETKDPVSELKPSSLMCNRVPGQELGTTMVQQYEQTKTEELKRIREAIGKGNALSEEEEKRVKVSSAILGEDRSMRLINLATP